MKSELPAFQKAYDLAKEILTRTGKFPRDYKFTLGDRLAILALQTLDLITRATYAKEKREYLDSANLNLERLRVLLRLSHDLGPLSIKGYEHVMVLINELGSQIGGWRKSLGGKHGHDNQEPLS